MHVFELVNETYGLVLWKPVMEVLKLRLIEEVRKRPKLWLKKRKKYVEKLWAEVGKILETDASLCKRTWQIMRIRFWVEKKRILIRIAKAKGKGTYDPKNSYTTWHLFDKLRFLENIKSGHRKYQSVADTSDIKIVKRKNSQYLKKKLLENKTLPNDNAGQIVAMDDSQQDVKNFDSHNLSSVAGESATISNENTTNQNNTFVKVEPELQIESDLHVAENENVVVFQDNNFIIKSIKDELPDDTTSTEDHYSRSPDTSDENYSFLYSFLSQTKLMTQLQKMEFRMKMKNLLLYIFPASSSVDILENQLRLAVDDDPDKKFLISFWPFMISMSLSQNLEFRVKMADLVLNCLITKTKRNSI